MDCFPSPFCDYKFLLCCLNVPWYTDEGEECCNLAVGYLAIPGWNSLWLVSAHVIINAFLELFGNQSTIFPATLWIWQTLPLAQIVWVTSSWLLVRMSCSKEIHRTFKFKMLVAPNILRYWTVSYKQVIFCRRHTNDSLYKLVLRVQVIHQFFLTIQIFYIFWRSCL